MSNTLATEAVGRLVRRLTVGAVAVIAGVILLYAWKVGSRSGFALSTDASSWAEFGDYVAGTLGPAFGFLAFMGVLLTLRLQAIQLDAVRSQAGLEEIQRLLATISVRLDQLLEQRVEHGFTLPSLRASPSTFFHALSAGGTALLTSSSDWMRQAFGAKTAEEAKGALAVPAISVGLELEQLAWCLGQYRRGGGSPEVIAFYKRRFGAVACWLDVLGFLASHPYAQEELDPQGMRPALSRVLN